MIRRIESMLRPPGFMSVVEAAQGSGSDPVYLYRAAVSGALPCVFGGLVGLVWVHPSDLAVWVLAGSVSGAGEGLVCGGMLFGVDHGDGVV